MSGRSHTQEADNSEALLPSPSTKQSVSKEGRAVARTLRILREVCVLLPLEKGPSHLAGSHSAFVCHC